MALESRDIAFPIASDNADGTVSLKLGKITFTERADELLFPDLASEEAAILLHTKLWCLENGFSTYGELLKNSAKLSEFNAGTKPVSVSNG